MGIKLCASLADNFLVKLGSFANLSPKSIFLIVGCTKFGQKSRVELKADKVTKSTNFKNQVSIL